jgi:hypothetical protein
MESLYFVWCDLRNIVEFYEHRLKTFWEFAANEISRYREGDQYKTASMGRWESGFYYLMNDLRSREERFLKTAREQLSFLETHKCFVRSNLDEIDHCFATSGFTLQAIKE